MTDISREKVLRIVLGALVQTYDPKAMLRLSEHISGDRDFADDLGRMLRIVAHELPPIDPSRKVMIDRSDEQATDPEDRYFKLLFRAALKSHVSKKDLFAALEELSHGNWRGVPRWSIQEATRNFASTQPPPIVSRAAEFLTGGAGGDPYLEAIARNLNKDR